MGLVGLLLVGCSKKSEEAKADAPAPTAAQSPSVSTTNAKPASPGATPAATTGAIAAPPVTALPPGRTALPTLDEWNAMTKEVTVKGSSALGCETKMIREYLRVSCRGKNDTGGTPKHIVLQKGIADNHIFIDRGVMSVVVAYVEGINATFLFSWTDTAHPLVLKWPRGSAKPALIGTFEGAKSPLDGTAIDRDLVKRCSATFGLSDADFPAEDLWTIIALNKYCVSTYRNDCEKLKECNFSEPSAPVKCPGDMVPLMLHFCLPRCGPGGSCPAGSSCSTDLFDGAAVCVED